MPAFPPLLSGNPGPGHRRALPGPLHSFLTCLPPPFIPDNLIIATPTVPCLDTTGGSLLRRKCSAGLQRHVLITKRQGRRCARLPEALAGQWHGTPSTTFCRPKPAQDWGNNSASSGQGTCQVTWKRARRQKRGRVGGIGAANRKTITTVYVWCSGHWPPVAV